MSPVHDLFQRMRTGDRAALARAITLVESSRAQDRAEAHSLLDLCMPHSGGSLRLGITGIPGVGKSTLIDALGMHLVEAGHRVAVLAVDPSSTRSGGSILGDKTRMERLSQSDRAYIRPSPTAGTLGGVARRTRETIVLCEAAGYDRVLIETVGVGQSELDVDRMTDLNLVLMLAGAGDELQGIKRGIMEAADLIAITKADAAGPSRAQEAQRDLRNAIGLLPERHHGRHPEVLLTDARTGTGLAQLAERIDALHAWLLGTGTLQLRRQEQGLFWLRQAVDEGLRARFDADPAVNAAQPALEQAVREGLKSPFQAADELLDRFRTGDAPLP